MKTKEELEQARQTIVALNAERETMTKSLSERRAELDKKIAEMNAEFYANNSELVDEIEKATVRFNELDAQLRADLLEYAEETQNKYISNALGVRGKKTFSYKSEEAIEWLIAHNLTKGLKVDEPQFKKIAELHELNFVTVSEEPITAVSYK